jgi:hypothetical protein
MAYSMSDKDSLKEQNVINLIGFYAAELRSVLEGSSIDDVFSDSEKKRLRSKGILDYNFPEWYINDRAKEILSLIQ